jgi:DNA-binding NtrC family response regulator
MPRKRVLVVDDEPGVRFGLRDFLEARGLEVDEAGTCEEAQGLYAARRPDAAVLDYNLPDGNALELIARLRVVDPTVPLVVLTAHGTIDLAVRALKEGADHFLTKPVEMESLLVVLERMLEAQRGRQRQMASRARDARRSAEPFRLPSAAMRALADEAGRVARSESPVLVLGETGVGKGLLATWLHEQGPRADEAFVDLNCASLTRELLESELFGHEKGAFTGATASKPGLLEIAHRGTLFLDEVGDVDLAVQPKLLTVLEEGRFRRLGDVRDRQVDVRLIAATHQDLPAAVRDKRFRGDLFFRISALPLVIPPLRERPADVPVLARTLLTRIADDLGRGELSLSPDAEEALQRYAWPGNTRELRNVLERAAILGQGRVLGARDLRFTAAPAAPETAADLRLTLEEVERRHVEAVLAEEQGHVERTARRLGVPRSSLYDRLRRWGMEPRRE